MHHNNCFPKANLPKMNFTQEKYIDRANKESKADQGCPKSLEVLTSMVTTKATKYINMVYETSNLCYCFLSVLKNALRTCCPCKKQKKLSKGVQVGGALWLPQVFK